MTVRELSCALSLKALAGDCASNARVEGCCIGDLLSWVMSHAKEGSVWITVIGSVNAIAVAKLVGAVCVVLCEGACLDNEAGEKADEHKIAVFGSSETAYTLALKIGLLLGTAAETNALPVDQTKYAKEMTE